MREEHRIPVFFLTAAEHSGDALGAALIDALKRRYPDARFLGVGGELMAAAGCQLLANPVKRSAMLAGAFLTESVYWWKLLRRIRGEIRSVGPDVVIPIDSSAVNLRIARLARAAGVPACYYVAPQLWASRPGRIKKIRTYVNTLCCILPFEEAYFRERGVHAVYVGHPMFDRPADSPEFDPARLHPTLEEGAPRVALFPGSRRAEITKHMPPMLKILAAIKGRFPEARFLAAAPSEDRAAQIQSFLRPFDIALDIRVANADAIIRWSDLVLTKSGTTTLQVARHAKPMVVMFAVPRWQWAIARRFILTPHIALVNILAGRAIVPEFIPFHGSAQPVADACINLLEHPDQRQAMSQQLEVLVGPLQTISPSTPRSTAEAAKPEPLLAADRVADEVCRLLAAPSPAASPIATR